MGRGAGEDVVDTAVADRSRKRMQDHIVREFGSFEGWEEHIAESRAASAAAFTAETDDLRQKILGYFAEQTVKAEEAAPARIEVVSTPEIVTRGIGEKNPAPIADLMATMAMREGALVAQWGPPIRKGGRSRLYYSLPK